MNVIVVYSQKGRLVCCFRGAAAEDELVAWLNGRTEETFDIRRSTESEDFVPLPQAPLI